MSTSPSRRARRAFARQAPPRRCDYCPALLSKVVDVDAHIARHLADLHGLPLRVARRLGRRQDGVPGIRT